MGDGIFLLIPILFPIVAGLVVFAINHRIARQIYVGTVLVLNAIAVFLISFLTETSSFTLWKFSDSLSITFRFDGVGKIFACLIAVIWTVACIYAFAVVWVWTKKQQQQEHNTKHSTAYSKPMQGR